MLLALEFPPISHLVEWPAFLFKGTPFAVNKVVLLFWLAALATTAFFVLGARQRKLVPTGVQGLAEATVGFVQDGIIRQWARTRSRIVCAEEWARGERVGLFAVTVDFSQVPLF